MRYEDLMRRAIELASQAPRLPLCRSLLLSAALPVK